MQHSQRLLYSACQEAQIQCTHEASVHSRCCVHKRHVAPPAPLAGPQHPGAFPGCPAAPLPLAYAERQLEMESCSLSPWMRLASSTVSAYLRQAAAGTYNQNGRPFYRFGHPW